MIDRKIIVPSIVLGIAVVAGAVSYTGYASANGNRHQEMVDELAQKLNIDREQIDTAMNEIHEARMTEMKAQRETRMNENLDKAVTDGVITAEQKQIIIDKRAAVQAERAQRRAEMDQWFADNGIDHEKLREYNVGFGGKAGFRGGHGMGMGRMQ